MVLMSLELMLNAANLAIVAFGRAYAASTPAEDAHASQIFTLLVFAVAAAEAAIGLSLLLVIYRRWRTIDIGDVSQMSG